MYHRIYAHSYVAPDNERNTRDGSLQAKLHQHNPKALKRQKFLGLCTGSNIIHHFPLEVPFFFHTQLFPKLVQIWDIRFTPGELFAKVTKEGNSTERKISYNLQDKVP